MVADLKSCLDILVSLINHPDKGLLCNLPTRSVLLKKRKKRKFFGSEFVDWAKQGPLGVPRDVGIILGQQLLSHSYLCSSQSSFIDSNVSYSLAEEHTKLYIECTELEWKEALDFVLACARVQEAVLNGPAKSSPRREDEDDLSLSGKQGKTSKKKSKIGKQSISSSRTPKPPPKPKAANSGGTSLLQVYQNAQKEKELMEEMKPKKFNYMKGWDKQPVVSNGQEKLVYIDRRTTEKERDKKEDRRSIEKEREKEEAKEKKEAVKKKAKGGFFKKGRGMSIDGDSRHKQIAAAVCEKAAADQPVMVAPFPEFEEDGDDVRYFPLTDGETNPKIKAATMEKLIEYLISPLFADLKFRQAFLLTYRSIISPDDLFLELGNIFIRTVPYFETEEEREAWDQTQRTIRIKVITVLKHWVKSYYWDFSDEETELRRKLDSFIKDILPAYSLYGAAEQLEKALEDKKREEMLEGIKITTLAGNISTIRRHKKIEPKEEPVMIHMDGEDVKAIAEQQTLLESSIFRDIMPAELLDKAWSNQETRRKRAPNIVAMIDHFNAFSWWVTTEIISKVKLKERVAQTKKFIQLAQKMYELNNFNGVMEVMSALNSSPVRRLKLTWEELKQEGYEAKLFQELHNLTSHSQSYKRYRESLLTATLPVVPYLGVYLTDLTFIEDGNPDHIDNLINWGKRMMIAGVIHGLSHFQTEPYKIEEIPRYQMFLQGLKPPTEQQTSEAYQTSLDIEPRNKSEAIEKLLVKQGKLKELVKQLQIRVSDLETANNALNTQNQDLMEKMKMQQRLTRTSTVNGTVIGGTSMRGSTSMILPFSKKMSFEDRYKTVFADEDPEIAALIQEAKLYGSQVHKAKSTPVKSKPPSPCASLINQAGNRMGIVDSSLEHIKPNSKDSTVENSNNNDNTTNTNSINNDNTTNNTNDNDNNKDDETIRNSNNNDNNRNINSNIINNGTNQNNNPQTHQSQTNNENPNNNNNNKPTDQLKRPKRNIHNSSPLKQNRFKRDQNTLHYSIDNKPETPPKVNSVLAIAVGAGSYTTLDIANKEPVYNTERATRPKSESMRFSNKESKQEYLASISFSSPVIKTTDAPKPPNQNLKGKLSNLPPPPSRPPTDKDNNNNSTSQRKQTDPQAPPRPPRGDNMPPNLSKTSPAPVVAPHVHNQPPASRPRSPISNPQASPLSSHPAQIQHPSPTNSLRTPGEAIVLQQHQPSPPSGRPQSLRVLNTQPPPTQEEKPNRFSRKASTGPPAVELPSQGNTLRGVPGEKFSHSSPNLPRISKSPNVSPHNSVGEQGFPHPSPGGLLSGAQPVQVLPPMPITGGPRSVSAYGTMPRTIISSNPNPGAGSMPPQRMEHSLATGGPRCVSAYSPQNRTVTPTQNLNPLRHSGDVPSYTGGPPRVNAASAPLNRSGPPSPKIAMRSSSDDSSLASSLSLPSRSTAPQTRMGSPSPSSIQLRTSGDSHFIRKPKPPNRRPGRIKPPTRPMGRAPDRRGVPFRH
eukprot:CAMPEP_0174270590 /NCGR_PEP_ID=MMETSP0439-20130205/44986_1 /TAXON_ID=0 /ORGANISM="Stereomyxa ramosa, Strain Chinc5" /LENGTH=1494 /DNA_ID=CAMNT_0015360015 /DNA_START=51 /DNA_END=4535 /DNA_ORIENTATION=-